MRYESPPGREQRPRFASEGAAESFDGDKAIIPPTTDLPLLARRPDHALLVTSGLSNGGVRRHVYFNLPSAQKALERARARGVPASVRLVRLVPAEVLDTSVVPSAAALLLGDEDGGLR